MTSLISIVANDLLKRTNLMDQLVQIENYLVDSRQIDLLARRQANLICRCIIDQKLRTDANAVVLLVFAALRKGTPRADAACLTAPVAPDMLSLHADIYTTAHAQEPLWLAALTGVGEALIEMVAMLFDTPDLFAPVSGVEPSAEAAMWPLLVVGGGYTGFSRYWCSAKILEEYHMPQRLKTTTEHVPADAVANALHHVFVKESILDNNRQFHYRQIAAAALACRTKFLVLSGGPGTGKTSVVLQILRTALRVFPEIRADRIVLCAPTGRAKARLGESIDAGLDGLLNRFPHTTDGALRAMQRKTIHGLLGQRPDGSFKYNRDNPLPAQVVVVDEASMVDLNLFAALMEACSSTCRLLLAGDMHQLPSVEAGALLGDLTKEFSEHATNASLTPDTAARIHAVAGGIAADGGDTHTDIVLETAEALQKAGTLADHVIVLTHSYRSSQAILAFAGMVNRGDARGACLLAAANGNDASVSLAVTSGIEPVEQWLKRHLTEENVAAACSTISTVTDAGELSGTILAAIKTVLFTSTILTLAHEGPRGRKAINQMADNVLREKLGNSSGDRFYHGLPIILGTNHHNLDLYNGDIGIVLNTRSEGTKVCFPRGTHHHTVALDRLINPEPAFALTVHKAQGSEFDNVLLVLPERESPLLTRQIIYTGITRAKKLVHIMGSAAILRRAIENRELRVGGVRV